ncbi:MAG: GNAT family N-acetyltransferase [Pseudomonadota bacterium]
MEVKAITLEDDLEKLVAEINDALWGQDNEMSTHDADSLTEYLKRQDTIFIACHEHSHSSRTLMGTASSRIEIKPYGKEKWLYVDELDVCANQRRKGVGRLLMRALLDIAEHEGCHELWLGAETENHAAIKLYQSLAPDDECEVSGFTWETAE